MGDGTSIKARLRDGPRGAGEFKSIALEDAYRTMTTWLSTVRYESAARLAMCVGGNTDFDLARHWAQNFGTKNLWHDRALTCTNAPSPTLGVDQDDSEETPEIELIIAFGSGLGRGAKSTQSQIANWKARGAKLISVNPVKSGLSSIADEWISIRPGCDEALLELVNQMARGAVPDAEQFDDIGVSSQHAASLAHSLSTHRGQIVILTGRGATAHASGYHFAKAVEALAKEFDAQIMAMCDAPHQPILTPLVDVRPAAIVCVNAELAGQVPLNRNASHQAWSQFEGHIICFDDQPTHFQKYADMIIDGQAEEHLLQLGARLGLDDFGDEDGASLFENGLEDYQHPLPPATPFQFTLASKNSAPLDDGFPLHAVSIKAHEGANKAIVFMHPDAAIARGIKDKDKVVVKSSAGKTKAMAVTMTEMNADTIWTFGGVLLSQIMPTTGLRDQSSDQPAWFDLMVEVSKA